MRTVRNFEDFIEEGIVKKQASDKPRANFLAGESEKSFTFLLEIIGHYGITGQNATTIIKLSYDIIMELIRACMLKVGYNASGQGAHEAEVSYLRKIGFKEIDVQFADQMRYFRNGITYYGRSLDDEYAKKVFDFMNKTYPKLKEAAKS
ncbi:MAG: hypothetical protein ABIF85_03075 [Nanoarchaeota archaeon]|nr:hypothetical protein [Nanoarchaeota archaeon]MBU4300238.1 hypothetical protein [Nanoarchaeota archaeon]MBU4451624.1 hypothetical protein [Nanoarchaeota archaeon]MCG2723146.1 hypothetical protein [archaeon]